MKYFVNQDSIVKEIWRKTDTVLFVFGGAAAEFALNKAVDWLYFTGKLPQDPIGRLFSTVSYAQKIIFEEEEKVQKVLKSIREIHQQVEAARGYAIPDWAYRDVLFMLIHYSIAAYELLERNLTFSEKEEVYEVFKRVGIALQLKDLPADYTAWQAARASHLEQDLIKSVYTQDLFKRYEEELGTLRYKMLVEVQKLLVPKKVSQLLGFKNIKWYQPVVFCYKYLKTNTFIKTTKIQLLPARYRAQLVALEK